MLNKQQIKELEEIMTVIKFDKKNKVRDKLKKWKQEEQQRGEMCP